MSEPLKPCPFCGESNAQVKKAGFVACLSCDAFGPVPFGETPEEAWNRRASEPTLHTEVKTQTEELPVTAEAFSCLGAIILNGRCECPKCRAFQGDSIMTATPLRQDDQQNPSTP